MQRRARNRNFFGGKHFEIILFFNKRVLLEGSGRRIAFGLSRFFISRKFQD
jgi:hypothetical protein